MQRQRKCCCYSFYSTNPNLLNKKPTDFCSVGFNRFMLFFDRFEFEREFFRSDHFQQIFIHRARTAGATADAAYEAVEVDACKAHILDIFSVSPADEVVICIVVSREVKRSV